jgi:hypothetical protein
MALHFIYCRQRKQEIYQFGKSGRIQAIGTGIQEKQEAFVRINASIN